MNMLIRFLGKALRLLGFTLLACAGLAIVAILIIGLTPFGAKFAADKISALASSEQQIVTISPPSGLLSGHLRVATITFSDQQGQVGELRDLAVDWSPLALLKGTFRAERIAAANLTVLRAPAPAQQSGESGGGFSLPVAIDIAQIDLPDILLGAPLAGREFPLSASGSLQADNQRVAMALTANRSDEPDAKANADIVFAPLDNRLTLKASIAEPKGGLLASMLLLPGSPAIALDLDGEGPLSDWAGHLRGAVDGQQVLAVAGKHMLSTDGRHRIALTGGGTPAHLLPLAFRPLFTGQTALNVAATFDSRGSIDIETGNITTGAVKISASGMVNPNGDNSLKANMTGVEGPVDFRWPMQNGQARLLIDSIDVALTGATTAAKLDMAAALQYADLPQGPAGGRLGNIVFTARGENFNLQTRTGTIETRLSLGGAAFNDPNIDRLIRAPFKLVAPLRVTPNAIGLDAATIESASIGGTVSGAYDLNADTVTGNVRLFLIPGVLPDALAQKFEGTIAAEGYINATLGGRTSLENIIVKSSTLEANGSVLIDGSNLTAKLGGRFPDLNRLTPDIKGAAGFSFEASGPMTALDVKGRVNSAEAVLAGRTLKALDINLQGKADAAAPTGTIKGTGSLDGQVIAVDANIVTQNGAASIPGLRVAVGPNILTGDLSLSAQLLPAGNLTFDFPDLSLLAALAAQQSQGNIKGTIALDNAGEKLAATIKAAGTEIRQGEVAIIDPQIDMSIPDVRTVAANGTIRAASAGSGSSALNDIVLDVRHGPEGTGFDLKSSYDGAALTTAGNIQTGNNGIAIALQSFAAAPRNIAVRLSKPSLISIESGIVKISGLTLEAGGGRLVVDGSAGQALDLSAQISAFPANLINSFVPDLGAEGTISGTVTVKGTAASPSVLYDLSWANAAVGQTRSAGIGDLTVTAKGQFANGTVSLDTNLSGPGGLSLAGGGSVAVAGDGALGLAFKGSLPFSVLAGQLAEQGFSLEGAASVDLQIGGAASAPQITGTVTTSGAKLIDVRRNLALNNLTANVAFNRDTANISSLSGTLSSGGSVSAQGTIGFASGSGFPANISVTLDRATYADGSLLTTTASGKLTLTGPLLNGPKLAGRISLDKTSITIPQSLPASLSGIDIKHRNAPADVRAQMRDMKADAGGGTGNTSSSPLALDLQVDANSGIFVRGRGINAELGGALTVRGTVAAPEISGGFTMRRGRMEILTKRLDFTSGTITFGGDLIPLLNMVATTSSGSTTITITLSGLANDPSVTFSSSPALPQDEILAQLIFGQSMSKLSALQIARLADAVSQLAGGRSSSLFDSLRSNLGVDDLDISTDAKGQARVSAGKYLNERTYLELEGGDSGGKAIINLDVGRGVKLRGEAGASGGGAGIFYEREY